MKHFPHFVPLLLAAALVWSPLRAQEPDLVKQIQEIATRIDEQLQEIDRLLLESGKKAQPRSKPREMLQQSQERSRDVETGIDELIQKLTEMKNSGGGQSQSSEQQQQQQQQQDQQGEKNQQDQRSKGQQTRRENQTPDFVKQPQEGQPQGQEPGEPKGQPGEKPGEQAGEKPGEQQPQQPGQGPPKGGQESNTPGENRQGNRQLEPDLGPGKPGEGEGSWGELQSYTNFIKNRGSLPTVPPKYRKYWEAYLKSKQGGTGTGK